VRIFDDGNVTAFIPDDDNGIFKTIKLSPDRMEHVLNIIYNSGIDDENILSERSNRYGCSSDLSIDLFIKDRCYSLYSCHPIAEREKGLVVTQDGVFKLEGYETKEEFLEKHASDDYKTFRKIWDQCFKVLSDLYLEITGTNINTYLVEDCEKIGVSP
jgi:hypothetical protein